MTPAQFRTIRKANGLSQSAAGRLLGLSHDSAGRTVRRWESGESPIPGSVALLMAFMAKPESFEAWRAQAAT